jgi:TPR repeat protein
MCHRLTKPVFCFCCFFSHSERVDAMFRLAARRRDEDEAVANEWFEHAALLDHGTLASSREAIEWYQRGADGGDEDSMVSLAKRYEVGIGVQKSMEVAVLWYKRAADNGHQAAVLRLIELYKDRAKSAENRVEMVKWLRCAVDMGDDKAKLDLAECYLTADATAAVASFRELLDSSDSRLSCRAALHLAELYACGKGVLKDPQAAFAMVSMAEKNDDTSTAMFAVIYCRLAGYGTAKDVDGALRLGEKLLWSGCTDTMFCLAMHYKRGNDAKRAEELLERALGNGCAAFMLEHRFTEAPNEVALTGPRAPLYAELVDRELGSSHDIDTVLRALGLWPEGANVVDAQRIVEQADNALKRRLAAYDNAAVYKLTAAFLACDVAVDDEVTRLVDATMSSADERVHAMHSVVKSIDSLARVDPPPRFTTTRCFFSQLVCQTDDIVVLRAACARDVPCHRALEPLVLALHTLTHIVERNRELNAHFGGQFFVPTIKGAHELRRHVMAALDVVDRSSITLASL